MCICRCSKKSSLLNAFGLSGRSHQRAGLSCCPGRNLILGDFCALKPCTVYSELARSGEKKRKPFSGSLGDGTVRAFVRSGALISDGFKCSYKMMGVLLLVHLDQVDFAKEDIPTGTDPADCQCSEICVSAASRICCSAQERISNLPGCLHF